MPEEALDRCSVQPCQARHIIIFKKEIHNAKISYI